MIADCQKNALLLQLFHFKDEEMDMFIRWLPIHLIKVLNNNDSK